MFKLDLSGREARILFLLGLFLFVFFVLCVRLIDLQIIHHAFYEQRSQEQRTRIINLSAQRGDVLDRNGRVFATTIDTYSVFTHEHGKFTWVARKLPKGEAEALKNKNPKMRGILKEKKRVYPKQNLAAQLLGFVGVDNQGLSGIELAFDEYLRGKEGQVVTEGDPEGRELYGALRELSPGKDGMNLTLTIDENLQYVAEREITAQIKQYQALSAMCIVMDAKSGEILALASKPDFDPNDYRRAERNSWHPRVLDPFEPGSTFKLITAASGLQEGVITPDSELQALDSIVVGGKTIENSHKVHWPGKTISISKMLEESINTGAAQIGLKLGPQKFYKMIKAFGFGETVRFGLQGESGGIVRPWESWWKPDIAMITFGQSIAVTPMQMLSAVSAVANEGKMVRPFVVKKIASPDENYEKTYAEDFRGTPLSKSTAEQMKILMENVVLHGSGRRAKMVNFRVGGKTGTAQKAVPGGRGYMKGHYIASFIGMAPLTDPRIIAFIIVDDPRGSIWGESVAGPVFKNVVEYSLRYLNVPPDML